MITLGGSKVVITGGAGFVGSWICDKLLKENVKEVILIDNLVRGSKDNITEALNSSKVKFVEGDIRDLKILDTYLNGADYCFHMAALRITHCAAEPRQGLEVMLDGAFNVMEMCAKHKIKKMVIASSASIYGQADIFPTKEDHHPYNNITFYGAAKAANELMARSFYNMYGLNYTALRYFNIYGPRMDIYGRYTEVLIRWYDLIKKGEEPLIFGDGKQTMDFIYIDDIASANILAMRSDTTDDVFNVASGTETSLEELCFLLLKVMGSKLKPKYVPITDSRKKVEVKRRLAYTEKSEKLLGFKAEYSLEEGLRELVAWLDKTKKV